MCITVTGLDSQTAAFDISAKATFCSDFSKSRSRGDTLLAIGNHIPFSSRVISFPFTCGAFCCLLTMQMKLAPVSADTMTPKMEGLKSGHGKPKTETLQHSLRVGQALFPALACPSEPDNHGNYGRKRQIQNNYGARAAANSIQGARVNFESSDISPFKWQLLGRIIGFSKIRAR